MLLLHWATLAIPLVSARFDLPASFLVGPPPTKAQPPYDLGLLASDATAVRGVGHPTSHRLRGAALPATARPRPTSAPARRDSDSWHVWRTADKLEREGLSVGSRGGGGGGGDVDGDAAARDLTLEVASILRQWGASWGGRPEWRGLLNKSSLTHEVEESIVALRSLAGWMDTAELNDGRPAVLVDACCGKGVFSMLASYLFRGDPRVGNIVMLDRAPIKWDHVDAANGRAEAEGRPPIEAWGGTNLHDIDDVADRLRALDAPCLLVGIHLCRMLSPACAGVANVLGPDGCPFLCLAPCCLPRAALSGSASRILGGEKRASIEVRRYETTGQRDERRRAKQMRDNATIRRPALDCYLCSSSSHPVHKCSLLPADEVERIDVFRKAAAAAPCWKCGEMGHFKADCPSDQLAGRPTLVKPPVSNVDVSGVPTSEGPFEEYCRQLSGAIQRDDVRLEDAGLVNESPRHQADNWNGGRKSIYIVAASRNQ